MATPLVAGLSVAAAAFVGKQVVQTYIKFKTSPGLFNSVGRQYYKGGFLPEMTRREAALILGIRESAGEERVKDAHRRIMVANHPDSGGSSYVAAKVNEAKDLLLGKKKARWPGGRLFAVAAGSGLGNAVPLMALLRAHRCPADASAWSAAAVGGDVTALEWLAANKVAMRKSHRPYMVALGQGDLATLHCLRRLRYPVRWRDVVREAKEWAAPAVQAAVCEPVPGGGGGKGWRKGGGSAGGGSGGSGGGGFSAAGSRLRRMLTCSARRDKLRVGGGGGGGSGGWAVAGSRDTAGAVDGGAGTAAGDVGGAGSSERQGGGRARLGGVLRRAMLWACGGISGRRKAGHATSGLPLYLAGAGATAAGSGSGRRGNGRPRSATGLGSGGAAAMFLPLAAGSGAAVAAASGSCPSPRRSASSPRRYQPPHQHNQHNQHNQPPPHQHNPHQQRHHSSHGSPQRVHVAPPRPAAAPAALGAQGLMAAPAMAPVPPSAAERGALSDLIRMWRRRQDAAAAASAASLPERGPFAGRGQDD